MISAQLEISISSVMLHALTTVEQLRVNKVKIVLPSRKFVKRSRTKFQEDVTKDFKVIRSNRNL